MNTPAFLIKGVLLAGIILSLANRSSSATGACSYFRTKTRVQRCVSTQVKPRTPETPTPADEFAESADVDDGHRIHLICSCDYSLSGSDLRCDLERTEEYEVLLVASDRASVCASAKKSCESLCPPRWP
jgi:hypothetical protein